MTCRNFVFAVLACCLVVCLSGCGGTQPPAPAGGSAATDSHGEHPHPERGPHQGDLIELGDEEYHAELIHDDATKTVIIYLLGQDAKTAVSIPDPQIDLNLAVEGKPLQVKLAAAPQEGDPAGEASKFTVVDEAALTALDAPKTTGRLNVSIAGKAYSGSLSHEAHGHKHYGS